jgi:hypothetical protein
VGQAIVFCGLPSSVGRTSWSAFFWPVELILGHYTSDKDLRNLRAARRAVSSHVLHFVPHGRQDLHFPPVSLLAWQLQVRDGVVRALEEIGII